MFGALDNPMSGQDARAPGNEVYGKTVSTNEAAIFWGGIYE